MPYSLSRDDLASIADVELAFSTDRLLPKPEDIPGDFWTGNVYTRLAQAIFSGTPVPDGEVELREAFNYQAAFEDLRRCVRAHLQSFGPKHEHKIAGVGFMISQVCEIQPGVALCAAA